MSTEVTDSIDVPPPSKDVDTSDLSNVVNELDSLCMNCESQGKTRVLLTKIPYFRDVVLMAFECLECGFRNSEIQSVGPIQDRGVQYTFKVENVEDLDRTIVKTDKAKAKIEELGIEIVPGKGMVTNIEDVVSGIASDLSILQEERKKTMPEVYEKLEEVILNIRRLVAGEGFPFTISLDDPTGNSWIEHMPGDLGGKLKKKTYARGPELNAELGYFVQPDSQPEKPEQDEAVVEPKKGMPQSIVDQEAEKREHAPLELPRGQNVRSIGADAGLDVNKQVHEFETTCPNCANEVTSNMTMVDIPFFKEVILMSLVCARCGYRSNEVKTGGAIPPLGQRITLKVSKPEDLDRSVVKSDTCAINSPELDFAYEPGSYGGCISTVEGIMTQIKEEIEKSTGDVGSDTGRGDSLSEGQKKVWEIFFGRLKKAIAGEVPFTLVFTDPLASTYVERLDRGGEVVDDRLTAEEYVRSRDEDESLGLLDMKTEGYENDMTIPEEDEEDLTIAEENEKGESVAEKEGEKENAEVAK